MAPWPRGEALVCKTCLRRFKSARRLKMILFKFKETPETRSNFPCTAFRWTLQSEAWWRKRSKGVSIGLIHQHKLSGKWYSSHTDVYKVSLTPYFEVGTEHVYYDGPHCMLDLGFIHFMWGNWKCKRCFSDES